VKVRTLSTVAVLATLACHEPTAPRQPSSAGGLTLSLAIAHATLLRGALDTLTATLTNSNPFPVQLTVGGCPLLFYVADAYGATVVPSGGSWACIEIIAATTIPAGGRLRRSFALDTAPLAAGVYSVYATFTAQGLQLATPPTAVALY
jgi:hypothetical protein